MATGIAQKSCTTLFPLRFLSKNDISKNKKYIQREDIESIESNFRYLNIEKKIKKQKVYLS